MQKAELMVSLTYISPQECFAVTGSRKRTIEIQDRDGMHCRALVHEMKDGGVVARE